MIAACPRCGARYRIDPARLRADGVRLRCSKCEAVFRITPPPVQAQTAAATLPPVQSQTAVETPPPVQSQTAVETPPPVQAQTAVETPPPAPVQQAVASAATPAPVEQAVASGAESASAAAPRSEEQRSHLVLLADAEVEAGKALANALDGWGLETVLVHDGVEAILTIQRILPRVVVLDAGLPKMFGFQVCELMKRNESLRSIHVVLVGAIFHQDRYRRAPSELYGADAYVERPQLPEALRPILRGFGLDVGGAAPEPAPPPAPEAVVRPAPEPAPPPVPELALPPAAPEPAPPPAPEPEVQPAPVASSPPPVSVQTPQTAGAEAAPDADVTNAERLARIIVSDIVLYNPEKFEEGVRDGNVLEALQAEVEEGRSHFEQRVELRVRESRDFLAEEIVRVARLRGMK